MFSSCRPHIQGKDDMKGKLAAFCIAVAAVVLPHAVQAQDSPDDMLKKIINRPPVTAWRVDGISGKPNIRSDPGVQYGKALRVEVPGKGEHPWSIAASNPIDKPVKAGDNLVLAFWARLENSFVYFKPTSVKLGKATDVGQRLMR